MQKMLRELFQFRKKKQNGGNCLRVENVGLVLQTSRAIISGYRILPAVNETTPRPSIDSRTSNRIVWEIPISGCRTVFMRVDRTNFYNDRQFVVFVKANEFYAVWRSVEIVRETSRSVRPELSQIPTAWKWEDQAECWEEGRASPVPLADVSYHSEYGIGFTDGITRTLWLLHNRAPTFPVLVRGKDMAKGLHELVGDPTISPMSIAELTD